jgi:hypothetical protein
MTRRSPDIDNATNRLAAASGEPATAGGPIGPGHEPGSSGSSLMTEQSPAIVERLRWDFKESFPPPLPEALNAGILSDENNQPEKIRAIHDEQARQLLATLRDLNFIGDARRRLFDPRTGEVASAPEEQERLRNRLFSEAQRLELWWQTLIDTYAQAFGDEAADAFCKAVRARNAGIEVIAEAQPQSPALSLDNRGGDAIASPVVAPPAPVQTTRCKPNVRLPVHPRTVSARFPIPRPLRAAIAAGNFGRDENGVIRPSAADVRSLTLLHSEKLIELLECIAKAGQSAPPWEIGRLKETFRLGLAAYAEDFGLAAAQQLEAFCRRQAHLKPHDDGTSN